MGGGRNSQNLIKKGRAGKKKHTHKMPRDSLPVFPEPENIKRHSNTASSSTSLSRSKPNETTQKITTQQPQYSRPIPQPYQSPLSIGRPFPASSSNTSLSINTQQLRPSSTGFQNSKAPNSAPINSTSQFDRPMYARNESNSPPGFKQRQSNLGPDLFQLFRAADSNGSGMLIKKEKKRKRKEKEKNKKEVFFNSVYYVLLTVVPRFTF